MDIADFSQFPALIGSKTTDSGGWCPFTYTPPDTFRARSDGTEATSLFHHKNIFGRNVEQPQFPVQISKKLHSCRPPPVPITRKQNHQQISLPNTSASRTFTTLASPPPGLSGIHPALSYAPIRADQHYRNQAMNVHVGGWTHHKAMPGHHQQTLAQGQPAHRSQKQQLSQQQHFMQRQQSGLSACYDFQRSAKSSFSFPSLLL